MSRDGGWFASLTRRGPVDAGVRQAAWLFTAAGTLGLVTDVIPGQAGYGKPASFAIDAVNFTVGLLMWTPLAARISRRASLVFPLLAMATVATSNAAGAVPPPTLGVWFILIFIWIGSWHSRGTAILLSPVAAVAYLAPMLAGAPRPPDVVSSVILVIPVGVLAAEVLARNSAVSQRSVREQERLAGELKRAVLTDVLTGLGNRRQADLLLDDASAGDAIAIVDIDNFKQVNDRFGHERGDALLRELGAFLSASLRSSDSAARMGGDEFMVVLRQTSLADATTIMDRLLGEWRARQRLCTLSVGLTRHEGGNSPSDLYRRADLALYRAKQDGRDRIALDVSAGANALPS